MRSRDVRIAAHGELDARLDRDNALLAELKEAVQLCIMGMVLLLVFWSRHIHAYRRLTEPLTALWGTLFAGLAIFGVSKGVAFYTLAVLPLGLFMLPLIETSISVVSAAFSPMPTGNLILYRKLLSRGMDHASAVHSVVMICAFIGCMAAFIQIGAASFFVLLAAAFSLSTVTWIFFRYASKSDRSQARKPGLWGIRVDNISLNYAISQVQHWINKGTDHCIIVTPDALAALRSRTDTRYRRIIRNAAMVLPDDRTYCSPQTPAYSHPGGIPGVEFTEHICKRASYEGWGIWFLGGQGSQKPRHPNLPRSPDSMSPVRGTATSGTKDRRYRSDIRRSGAKVALRRARRSNRNTGSRTILQRPERQSAWA